MKTASHLPEMASSEKIIQSVNLYSAEFYPRKVFFSAFTMLMVCGIYLIILSIAALSTNLLGKDYKKQQEKLIQENQAMDKTLGRLRLLQEETDPKGYQEKIHHLQEQRLALTTLLQRLQRGSGTGTSDFVAQLEGFSRHVIDGVSLEVIALDQESGRVALQGKVSRPEYIPTFIDSLTNDPVFRESVFGPILISHSEKEPFLDFSVGNVPVSQPGSKASVKSSARLQVGAR